MGKSILIHGARRGGVFQSSVWYEVDFSAKPATVKELQFPLFFTEEGDAFYQGACVAVGSSIYVTGGVTISQMHDLEPSGRLNRSRILCIDALQPEKGWEVCANLPFNIDDGYTGTFAVLSGKYIYVITDDGCNFGVYNTETRETFNTQPTLRLHSFVGLSNGKGLLAFDQDKGMMQQHEPEN